uniref:Uncharacterized protein n=1 Tax=Arundo donax TaxID=35708 RepID=A0A0A9CZT9_ARUDO
MIYEIRILALFIFSIYLLHCIFTRVTNFDMCMHYAFFPVLIQNAIVSRIFKSIRNSGCKD